MTKTDSSDLASQIKSIQDELIGLTETIRSFATERIGAGTEALRGAADAAGDTARFSADEARRRGQKLADELEGHITGNPLPAVLVAAGIGLVIGAVLSRR